MWYSEIGGIDGEMRSEIAADAEVPVLVLDVTEEEADYLLATLDPVTSIRDEIATNGRV